MKTKSRSYSNHKYYCLRCETQAPCKCGLDDKKFSFSHKLRPPTNTGNRSKFRKFLQDCRTFANIPCNEHKDLRPDFIRLLIKVKWFEQKINGFDWTYVPESRLARIKLYGDANGPEIN